MYAPSLALALQLACLEVDLHTRRQPLTAAVCVELQRSCVHSMGSAEHALWCAGGWSAGSSKLLAMLCPMRSEIAMPVRMRSKGACECRSRRVKYPEDVLAQLLASSARTTASSPVATDDEGL